MKPRHAVNIMLAFLVLFLILIICFGASSGKKTEIIQNESQIESAGTYYLFKTFDVQEYLKFLENFDETKYEIVDISTSLHYIPKGSDEFYMVTYKTR